MFPLTEQNEVDSRKKSSLLGLAGGSGRALSDGLEFIVPGEDRSRRPRSYFEHAGADLATPSVPVVSSRASASHFAIRGMLSAAAIGVASCFFSGLDGETGIAIGGEPTPASVQAAAPNPEQEHSDRQLKSVLVGPAPEQPEGLRVASRLRNQPPAEEVPASPIARRMTIEGVDVGARSLLATRINIDPKPEGENRQVPEDYAKAVFSSQPPLADIPSPYHTRYTAFASATAGDFCYRPLYFEEVNLERYGRNHGIFQPWISGARFAATVPALPYLMTVYRPEECYYWNHPYEAGRPAPHERELPPFSLEAGLVEAGVVTGLIFLFP